MYIFLEPAYGEIRFNKADNENLLIFLYTAIAASTNETIINLAVGLPISQYKDNKQKLIDTIINTKIIDFKYNDKPRKIIIENVSVYPEGVGAYFMLPEQGKKCILIDIGGKTTDISYMTPKATEPRSILYGTLDIQNRIRKAIETKYEVRLTLEEIEDILKNGFYYINKETRQLEKQNIKFAMDTTKDIFKEIYNELKLGNYPIDSTPVVAVGGGSQLLGSILKSKIPQIRIESNIFLNVLGFKKMLDSLNKNK